ncbi:MAG TPA: hypothetical protein VMW62_14340 [Chloroflexota bacterium]|nr:hypothetical protein [Chloroflexota bacterium]
MSLVARGLEARGLPTLSMSTLHEVTAAYKPPRPVFLDFPIGCPGGRPHQVEQQRGIARAYLAEAPTFEAEPNYRIHELPFDWAPDGDRGWEEEVRNLYRAGVETVASHSSDHGAKGESLAGNERAFTIRCNC